ncbi:MAG: bifunctional hydroxymethylpyrimidine kinase/phosphomethylpyrimidine kinase [Bacteroidetes bacterium SB0662_bin_6]|nr:bifunctional hydroxymethylpyrimidine kinase/phosphomethylpyrimidine kinase [Bacteroidetes bacterium SB0668_bin_1]MYE03801.1 bifunctional hydroxymethylpyrimidine kinase/phosphomethylpyrimidine kinase [Bacteroidetes bacterium SB0662_bin_6]
MNVALTIAGSDSGGGAGIQADMKAMQAQGVFAASVVTAVTAQNTQAVLDAFELPPDLIAKQIDAVYDDFTVGATKTGMLSSAAIIEIVAEKLQERRVSPLVVDPVMISKSGFPLLRDDAVETLRERLLPLATLVTPNAHEARRLTGLEVDSEEGQQEAAAAIHAMGPGAVLVKGGHVDEAGDAVDVLYDGKRMRAFRAPRIATENTHGTGCTYASAIAANLARGFSLKESVARAKRYVTEAIRHAPAIGQGHGPVSHFYFLKQVDVFPPAE